MKALLVARRELYAYFRSPLGSVVVAGILLVDGILFYWQALTEKLLSAQVLEQFLYLTSGAIAVATVFLSMRLLAEERQTGTITMLTTAPIKDWEIVLGKYLSLMAVVVGMTALTAYMPALIFVNGKVSTGHIAVGYLGLVLLGSAVASIGLFSSALTKSQVVAVITTAAILAPLYLLWVVAKAVDPPLNEFLSALAIHHENFKPFMTGTLELRAVAYYLVVTYFFLLAATKVTEARRWR